MTKEYLNSGALFVNRVKKKEKSPDYSGELLLDLESFGAGEGKVKVRLAGWKKVGKSGTTFLSLSASAPLENKEEPRQAQQQDFDDDIPF